MAQLSRALLLIFVILSACSNDPPLPNADGGADMGMATDSGLDAFNEPDASHDMSLPDDLGDLLDMGVLDANLDADVDGSIDAGNACSFADALDDSCTEDSDCEYFVHQTDCCGNTFAYGVNVSDIDQALAREPLCRDYYPACGCPAMQTNTDSDERVGSEDSVQVGCIQMGTERICMTYVAMRPVDVP